MILTAASVGPYLNAGKTILFFDSLILEKTPEATDVGLALLDLKRTLMFPGQELATLSFAINHNINNALGFTGFHAPGFVVVNVALHVVNVWLLYVLLKALVRVTRPNQPTATWIPLAVTMLYAVHPIHVTTILDVVQRRGILAGIFQTVGLLAYMRCRNGKGAKQRIIWAAVTATAFWLCMKSRSTGLAMPLILIALELVLQLAQPERFRRFLKWGSAALATCVLMMLIYMWKSQLFEPTTLSFRSPQTMNTEANWSGGLQAISQARAYPKYWSLLAMPRPADLCIDHAFPPVRRLTDGIAWVWVCLHVMIVSAAIYAARRGLQLASFGILFFYACQVPWLLLPHPLQVVEYRLYSAAVAPCLILLELFIHIERASWRGSSLALCAGVAAGLAPITWQRNQVFRSHVQIWQDVATKHPLRFRSEYNLANALFRESRFEEAEAHYLAACKADPNDHRPHYNLANALLKMGRNDEAAREYLETLRRKPEHAGARQGLAECKADR